MPALRPALLLLLGAGLLVAALGFGLRATAATGAAVAPAPARQGPMTAPTRPAPVPTATPPPTAAPAPTADTSTTAAAGTATAGPAAAPATTAGAAPTVAVGTAPATATSPEAAAPSTGPRPATTPSAPPAAAGPTARAAPSPAAGPPQAAPGTTAHCLVLAYHFIAAPEPFAAQLAALQAAGFGVVPLERLVQYVKGVPGTTLPERCLVITFDDGWRGQFTYARPALLASHLPATFFVITNYADQHYASYMNWDMITLLADEGFDVEDHTRSHPRLDLLSRQGTAALADEIAGSLQDLEAHVGKTRRIFCYPYGTFNPAVLAMVAQHYDAAMQLEATGIQRPDERYTLHRVMVETTYTPQRLIGIASYLETR